MIAIESVANKSLPRRHRAEEVLRKGAKTLSRRVRAPVLTVDLRMYRSSGIGRYLQTLMPGLAPRLNAERIVVLCSRLDLEREAWTKDPRIELRQFSARPFSVAEQLTGMGSVYRQTRLLWTPQYNIPLLYRGKLLVTIHDLCQLAHPEMLANWVQRMYSRKLLSAVAARASAILCVSHFTAREVQKYLGVGTDRLTVAHPSISNLWRHSISEECENKRARYLLTVGNIKRHKNIRTLIAAFGLIRNQIPHDLVIIGQRSGFLNADNELTETDSMMDGRVRFTGFVSDSNLHRYYSNADAFVFPSIYEGFGFPVLEAMALGCPVACSRAASLPEVVGDAAVLFDPLNPKDIAKILLQILGDENLRNQIIARGLRRAEEFRRDTCASETATVINRLTETS